MYYDYVRQIYKYTLFFIPQYQPVLYCAKDSYGKILMIAPLKKNIFKNTYKMLCDIQGCGMSDFLFSPTSDTLQRTQCIDSLFEKIGAKTTLRRVNQKGFLNQYLEERPELTNKKEKEACVSIKLPHSFEEHFTSLSPSVRQNIRTAYNRMKRDHKMYDIQIYDGNNKPSSTKKTEIMNLYLQRLFSKYKKNNGIKSWHKKFMYRYIKHDTISLFSQQNQYHIVLRVNGEIAGFMSGFRDHANTKIVIPRLAINESFRFYSPGYILLCEAFKKLIAETTIREIDLSRGDEKYKFDLGGAVYNTCSFKTRNASKAQKSIGDGNKAM